MRTPQVKILKEIVVEIFNIVNKRFHFQILIMQATIECPMMKS